MSAYCAYSYIDLAKAIQCGLSMRDTIHVLGDIPVPPYTPPVDYWVHPGGLLSIASSSEASVHIAGGHLHIVSDGPLALQPYGTDTPGGRVTLVGCIASDVDAVRRVGAPYGWDIQATPAHLEHYLITHADMRRMPDGATVYDHQGQAWVKRGPWWHLDCGGTRLLGTELTYLSDWLYVLEPYRPARR